MGNNGLISGAFSSDTTLSTPVAINKGGTGQTTAQAALDALAAASGSLVQGDIFIVDSSGNVVRLARGSDNQTLVMDGNNPNWETASGGGASTASVTGTSTFSTDSTSFVDVTNVTLTLPTTTAQSEDCLFTFCGGTTVGSVGNNIVFQLLNDSTVVGLAKNEPTAIDTVIGSISLQGITDADGGTGKLQMKISGGNASSLIGSGTQYQMLTAFAS